MKKKRYNPLNPQLFYAIRETCPRVEIIRELEPAHLEWRQFPGEKYEKEVVVSAGEAYRIDCPVCDDVRQRCTVSYLFGSDNKYGQPRINMAHCYNDACPLHDRDVAAFEKLDSLFLSMHPPEKIRKPNLRMHNATKHEPFNNKMPGKTLPFSKIPEDHEVCEYLRGRRFDPVELAKQYRLGLCVSVPKEIRMALDRLIIPVFQQRKLVSWQARSLEENLPKGIPKYYTAPNSGIGEYLYNIGAAKNCKTVVVMEGVVDVWRFGREAVCTFGAKIGETQCNLLSRLWKSGEGVLLFDDAKAITKRTEGSIAKLNEVMEGGFHRLALPDARDPGDWETEDLRKWVKSEVRRVRSGRKTIG